MNMPATPSFLPCSSRPWHSTTGVLALAMPAMLATLAACGPGSNAFAPPPPPKVTVALPVQKDVTSYLKYSGTTEADQAVDLRARVAGFLDEVRFRPGASVAKDELLFVIDRRQYQAAVGRADARLASAQAAHLAATSDASIAEDLAAHRAGSEIDRINKVAQREAAKATIQVAEADLVAARLDLDYCEVRAPFAGRITKNHVDVGNLVGHGESTVLARLVATRPVLVTVDVSESDLLALRRARLAKPERPEPGQVAPGEWWPVELALADRDEFSVHGRVDYVDPLLDPESGTIRIRCRFANDDDLLLPGLFVRLRFPTTTRAALLVPDIALPTDQAGRYALVVDDQNVVQVRRVEIGVLDGTLRVVHQGLAPGDRVVVNGLLRARPGAVVAPAFAAATATGPIPR